MSGPREPPLHWGTGFSRSTLRLLGDPEQRGHHDVLSRLCEGPPLMPLRSAEVFTFANTLVFCQAPFTPSPRSLLPSGSGVRTLSPNVPQPSL